MQYINDTESSSHEETRCQFKGRTGAIKLGIDVHQDFYVVVTQEGGSNPKPPQRFRKEAFLHWAAKLKRQGAEAINGTRQSASLQIGESRGDKAPSTLS